MPRVYVAIGSNLEPERHVRAAVQALRARFGHLAASPVYACPPVGFEGPEFLNLVVAFDTDEPPRSLVRALKAIEETQGRRRDAPRFADRTLDLDLLMYGDEVLEEEGLRVPRPEILEHAHVLGPLCDLAGDRVHPCLGRTFRAVWAELDQTQRGLRRAVLEIDTQD
jgi:2-amino-4-hydroxy-6-hydroxymethyldihydropteridine diphosphokinase